MKAENVKNADGVKLYNSAKQILDNLGIDYKSGTSIVVMTEDKVTKKYNGTPRLTEYLKV